MSRPVALCLLAAALLAGVFGATLYMQFARTAAISSGLPRENSPAASDLDPFGPPGQYADVPLAGVKVYFADVTATSGIRFEHFDGRTDKQYVMDETGSGLGWLDFDQDGLLDLFIVQGSTFVGEPPQPPPTSKFFRNLGGGKFQDVTAAVGLAHVGCGQGIAVGDIDNDGYPDLFLTCYGKPNVLYRNTADGKGGRRFDDITARAGLTEHPDWRTRPNYSLSAAFLDYDNDGYLDLFVCSYVHVDLANYPECRGERGKIAPCHPRVFRPTRCLLYRNRGDGTFREVGRDAGVGEPNAKAMGVVALDLDDDGRIDLFVANDSIPNFFFRNLGQGRFQSMGLASGCAVNVNGVAQAYMGVDADDLTGDGRPDLYVTAFNRETDTLFCNQGNGKFLDIIQVTGLGPPTFHPLAFGTCLLDADRDGRLDIFVSNGHVSRYVDDYKDPTNTYRQLALFFLNEGRARFRDISTLAGPYFKTPHAGRAAAQADYDNDGHMDLALSNSGESAVLLHNESITPGHWIRLELRGTKSNRDAVGAKVTVHIGGRTLVRHRKGGSGYLSAHDPRLLIGVGTAQTVEKVEVRWPSGHLQTAGPLEVDRGFLLIEGDTHLKPRP